MKQFSFLALAACLLVACTKTAVETPVTQAEELEIAAAAKKPASTTGDIVFMQANLFPEGVVYDRFNNRFYVSSTTRGDIGIVTSDGSYTAFITDPALVGTTGLEIDEAHKRLWVSNSPGSVGVYDINTGQRIFLVDLKALIPGAPAFINDIALDPQGNAYVTNSNYPVIYKITRDGQASIFYQDPAFATAPGSIGFNGIEYGNSNGGYLLVAFSAGNQIIKFPLSNPAAYNRVQLDAALANPDGLLLSKDGKGLVVVNNAGGGQGKVIYFTSDDKWQTGMAQSTFITGPVFPTTATTDGKSIFVLYAYLNRRATGQNEYTIKQVPLGDTRPF